MNKTELLQNAKPILFNTEMVRAILDGRKTVTRRLIKPQLPDWCECFGYSNFTPKRFVSGKGFSPEGYAEIFFKLLYQPGDILYVRETWAEGCMGGHIYKAGHEYANQLSELKQWKPSIHMPKEAARIFLLVKDVRVTKLQYIGNNTYFGNSTEDYFKEGIYYLLKNTRSWSNSGLIAGEYNDIFKNKFIDLWNSTIKKSEIDKYGWEANPFVWVIEFEKVSV